jgi:hypothetical protein
VTALVRGLADGATEQRLETAAGPVVPRPGVGGGRLAPEPASLSTLSGRLEIGDAIEDRPIQRRKLLGR